MLVHKINYFLELIQLKITELSLKYEFENKNERFTLCMLRLKEGTKVAISYLRTVDLFIDVTLFLFFHSNKKVSPFDLLCRR